VERVQHTVIWVDDTVDTSVGDMLAPEEPEHILLDLLVDTQVAQGIVFSGSDTSTLI